MCFPRSHSQQNSVSTAEHYIHTARVTPAMMQPPVEFQQQWQLMPCKAELRDLLVHNHVANTWQTHEHEHMSIDDASGMRASVHFAALGGIGCQRPTDSAPHFYTTESAMHAVSRVVQCECTFWALSRRSALRSDARSGSSSNLCAKLAAVMKFCSDVT
eukprot:7555-Heterococcus_DN1.PRE.3